MTERENQVRSRLLELAARGHSDMILHEDKEEYDQLLLELKQLVSERTR